MTALEPSPKPKPKDWRRSYWGSVSVLDRDFDRRREYESSLIRDLRNGKPIHTLSAGDLFPTEYQQPISWEKAEEHSKDAIRTNATWLNDRDIANRIPRRQALKEALREAMAEASERTRLARLRAAEEAKAKAEAHQEYLRRKAERERQDAEIQRRWEEGEAARRAEMAEMSERERLVYGRSRLHQLIMESHWQCQHCLKRAFVTKQEAGYMFTCMPCQRSVPVTFERAVELLGINK